MLIYFHTKTFLDPIEKAKASRNTQLFPISMKRGIKQSPTLYLSKKKNNLKRKKNNLLSYQSSKKKIFEKESSKIDEEQLLYDFVQYIMAHPYYTVNNFYENL